jgi:hypothetical protein
VVFANIVQVPVEQVAAPITKPSSAETKVTEPGWKAVRASTGAVGVVEVVTTGAAGLEVGATGFDGATAGAEVAATGAGAVVAGEVGAAVLATTDAAVDGLPSLFVDEEQPANPSATTVTPTVASVLSARSVPNLDMFGTLNTGDLLIADCCTA